jgi:hypothetical protein
MSLHGLHVSDGSFLALVDQDGDGLLSFGEYMFFLTLLAGRKRPQLVREW